MDTTTIFLYLVVACLGVALGALVQGVLYRRKSPPNSPTHEQKPANEEDEHIFTARRAKDGKVWLEMDGARLNSKDGLKPEQRQRLLNTIIALRPWLETARPVSAGEKSVAQPPGPVQAAQPQAMATTGKAKSSRIESTKPASSLKSIVEQIDEVLQVKLMASPFKDRLVSLTEDIDGAVIVKDGENQYMGIDAVPDPAVKALIRQAIEAWEKSIAR